MNTLIFPDGIVARVACKLAERSHLGITKYRTTLEHSKLGRLAILRHAQEEALDLANYLQVEIEREETEEKRREELAAAHSGMQAKANASPPEKSQ